MYFKIDLNKIIIILYLLILMSVFTVILDNKILLSINSILYLSFFLYLLLTKKTDLILKLFIITLLLINLGTLITSWDARSIWIFKTKIFFYEENYFNLHYHPQFSHPTYPFLGPIFSSLFVKTFGFWNEIYPKIGLYFLFIPPIIYISTKFKDNYLYAFLSLLLLVIGKYFFNGEMDGLISIYFLCSLILIYEIIFLNKKNDNFILLYILFLNNLVLSLLKFEGTVLVVIISTISFLYFFISKKIKIKTLIMIILSSIPSLIWLFYSNHLNSIYNLENSNFTYSNFINRINDFNNLFLILKFFISDEKFLLSVSIFLYIYFKNKKKNDFLHITILTNTIYIFTLIMIYLATNFDLEWHLSSSANRVIKPITLSLIIISLYHINFKKKKIFNI